MPFIKFCDLWKKKIIKQNNVIYLPTIKNSPENEYILSSTILITICILIISLIISILSDIHIIKGLLPSAVKLISKKFKNSIFYI